MKLYENIKKVAKSRDCSISKMEKDLDLGKSVTSKFDEHTPSIEKIVKIADYFNVSVDVLIGRPTMLVSPEEAMLLSEFNALNKDGKELVLRYAQFMNGQPLYKKSDTIENVG